jgi:uncharacterized delta-60 repeat protein
MVFQAMGAIADPRRALFRIGATAVLITCSLLVSCVVAHRAVASSVGLDPDFGGSGEVTATFTNKNHLFFQEPPEARSYSVVVDPQGRVVEAGTVGGPRGTRVVLIRYLPNGLPDPSFGPAGRRIVPQNSSAYIELAGVALDSRERLVVAYSTSSYSRHAADHHVALARYLPDGTLDPSFAAGGLADIQIGFGCASTMAIDAQDRILVGCGGYGAEIYRFDASSGQPDTTFHGTGGLALPRGTRVSSIATDGDAVLVGSHGPVLQLTPAGRPAPSFGVDGIAELPASVRRSAGAVAEVATLPHHRVVVLFDDGVLIRFGADGSPDERFGQPVWRAVPRASRNYATSLAVDSRGRMVVGGGVSFPYKNTERWLSYLTRFLADGAEDPSFTPQLTGFGYRFSAFVTDIAIDSRDRILTAAMRRQFRPYTRGFRTPETFALARYSASRQ